MGRPRSLLPFLDTRLKAPAVIALVMGALLACGSEGVTIDEEQLRDDVLYCEDAVGRLEECCQGFVPERLACVHYKKDEVPTGCDGQGTASTAQEEPALNLTESKCIQASSCEALVSNGVCRRAQAARALRSGSSHYVDESGRTSGGTSYDTPHEKVCP